MAKGAFQTSREIFENPIWTDVVKFRLFFYIYGNAVFAKDGTMVANIHLKRGQFLRSYRNLANDLSYMEKRSFKNYSISTIKAKVEQLVKENRIEIEPTDYGTLFTVVNYDEYQGFERYSNLSSEQQPNGARTATERQPNNNKNVKNDKKENTSPTSAKPKYGPDDVPYKIASHLLNAIRENNPKFSLRNDDRKLQSWANDIRLAHERDGRDYGLLDKMVTWCQNDSFWKTNILSGAKLRKQYDQMAMRANEERAQKRRQRANTSEPRGLTPEEGSARSARQLAELEEKYKKEGIGSEQ